MKQHTSLYLLFAALGLYGCSEIDEIFNGPDDEIEMMSACITQVRHRLVPPAGIQVRFRALGCDGEPLGDLSASELQFINDVNGNNFGQGGEGGSASDLSTASDFRLYLSIALDLSQSIVSDACDGVDDANDCPRDVQLQAARELVEIMLGPDGVAPERTFIQIIRFSSSSETRVDVPFTNSIETIQMALSSLSSAPGGGTTALYNAYVLALNETARAVDEARTSGVEFVEQATVIFTDGTDEAGDLTSRRRQALEEKDRLRDIIKFSIGLQNGRAFNQERLRELASDDSFFLVENLSEIGNIFRRIGRRLSDIAGSNYVVGICTPIEFGEASLTIRINTSEGYFGEHSIAYNDDDGILNGDTTACDEDLVRMGN